MKASDTGKPHPTPRLPDPAVPTPGRSYYRHRRWMIAIASVGPTPVSFSLMRYVLHIHDPADEVTSTMFVTYQNRSWLLKKARSCRGRLFE